MARTKQCKHCKSEFHSSLACFNAPRKPIKRSVTASNNKKAKSSTKTKAKPKTRSKSDRAKAKEKAWKAFSDYIRMRDCLATTGTTTHCICVTCSVRGDYSWKEYKQIQAGHAVGGRGNAVLFNEKIVNGQCGYCNRKPPMGLGGDYGNYAIWLAERYGLEEAKSLQMLRHNTSVVYKIHNFIEVEKEYKEKLLTLC